MTCAAPDLAYEQGQRDERERITKAVEALPYGTGTTYPAGAWLDRAAVLAAIDAIKGGSE